MQGWGGGARSDRDNAHQPSFTGTSSTSLSTRHKRPLLIALFFVLFLVLYHWPEDDHKSKNILDSPQVTEAPEASDTGSFRDARGAYQRHVFGEGSKYNKTYVNLVYTHKGHSRSGDLHACEQVNHLVWGRAKLTRLIHGEETETLLRAGETVKIAPHVPHLYYFVEDTLMTEVWQHPGTHKPCPFKAWYFQPFRDRIAAESVERTDVKSGGDVETAAFDAD